MQLLLLAIFSAILTNAQKTTLPSFGVADYGELQLKSCSFENDANAMKLFDIQESEYEPSAFGGKIVTKKRVRIKIFNEKGYKHASVRVPYYAGKKSTHVGNLEGVIYTLNEEGKISTEKLSEEDFYKQKLNDRVGMISFTFPNLKAGCVLEYQYTIEEKRRLEFDFWFIQSDLPVAYTEMITVVPTFSAVKAILFGNDTVSQKKEILTKGLDKEKTIYYKENIKSFRREPFMSSVSDNLLRMGFILSKQKSNFLEEIPPQSIWRMAANLLLKSGFFDEQFKKQITGTDKIVDTASKMFSPEDKLRYLYNVVKKRILYTEGQALYADDIADAWKRRKGSSAEINMILMNLLKRSGVNCHPIFVSTREHGKINTDFPNFGQFNGCDILVTINNTNYLIDASIQTQSYKIPPINILNRKALLMDPDNINWLMITDDRPLFKETTALFATINKSGIIEAGASITSEHFAKKLAMDTSQNNENSSAWESLFKMKTDGIKIISDKSEDLGLDQPFTRSLEFDIEATNAGNFYFIHPQLLFAKNYNPFKDSLRLYDIDLGCNQEIRLNLQLEVPATFALEQLPKSIVIRSPDSSIVFSRLISQSGRDISLSQILEIRKALFDKSNYAGLSEFFRQVIALMSEEIIVKKNE